MILDFLAQKHKTDKNNLFHDYCDEYEFFLKKFRDKEINLLEFGVYHGASIKMWLDYFSKAIVYGVDIENRSVEINNERYKFIQANQVDENLYKRLESIDFDIVVDDALHNSDHQIFAFEKIFPRLKSNAIYIVEDTCTSYWNWECKKTFTNYAKDLIDEVNYNGILCDKEYNDPTARNRKDLNKTLLKNNIKRKFDIKSMYCSNSFILFIKN